MTPGRVQSLQRGFCLSVGDSTLGMERHKSSSQACLHSERGGDRLVWRNRISTQPLPFLKFWFVFLCRLPNCVTLCHLQELD